jgi:hypothetical protein
MSEINEQLIEERFRALAREAPADWRAIERRARAGYRRVALVAASLLAAVVVSAPAFGWHRSVLNWLEASDASTQVKLDFARLDVGAPKDHKLGIAHEEARTVMTVTHDGKSYTLSVAPTESGGFCFWWEDLTASCRQQRTPPPIGREQKGRDIATFRLGTNWMPDRDGVVQTIAGNLIGANIEQLSAVYADGTRDEVPVTWVSPPIDAGFYLFFVPDEHRTPSKHLSELVATDAEGDVVARQTFALTSAGEKEGPARLPNGQMVSLPAKAIVAKAAKVIDFTAGNGRQMTLWEMPTTEGGVCYVFNRGGGCPPKALDVALAAGILGGSVPVLFAGQARLDVAEIVLRYEDGTEERIRPTRGYVMTEIATDHYARGHRLREAIAVDAAGAVLARQPMSPSGAGIYPCDKPVDQGYGVKMCP